jgi:hypothetical protein
MASDFPVVVIEPLNVGMELTLLIRIMIRIGSVVKPTRAFSQDHDILAEVKRTRGDLSESDRMNRLLRLAWDREKRAALELDIAGFFAANREDRAERRAFEAASRESWTRE